MDENVDFIESNWEEMMRLDQFKALVHHRRRIDTDFGTHFPIGVGDRLLGGDRTHLVECVSAERPAACGQCDFADLIDPATGEALEDSIMLTIDREQGCSGTLNSGHHQRTG